MNDDRHDDTSQPQWTSGGSDSSPGEEKAAGPPPPPTTPVQPGGSPVPPPPPGTTKPADYYAQPPASTEPKKGCGKWLVGCGIAGCLVGILLIVGFVWMVKSGWPLLMSRMVSEVETHIEDHGEEIDPDVREELKTELGELRRHIEDGDVTLQDMEGIVYSIQEMIGDQQITTAEAEEFLEDLRKVNEIGASGEF